MTRKQDRERWRRQSVVRVAGRARAGLRVADGRPPWCGPVPARPCCPAGPASTIFCSSRYHSRRAAGDPHTRAKPGRFPAPAACRSHAFRFSPGSGRPTGPEPVRAVPSRRPSRQEAARAFPGDLKPGTADVFDGTNAVRFSINRDPCPARRPGHRQSPRLLEDRSYRRLGTCQASRRTSDVERTEYPFWHLAPSCC